MNPLENILNSRNIMYHGTSSDCVTSLRRGIVLESSRKRTDFGVGFYLTANKEQAAKWAMLKADFVGIPDVFGAVMSYEIDIEKLIRCSNLFFDEADDFWADFIFANRVLDEEEHNNINGVYDVVFGPLGDGFKFANNIKRRQKGAIDTKEFRKSITNPKYPFPEYHQFSLHTQRGLGIVSLKGVDFVG